MRTILIYLENWEPGGLLQYAVDIVNSIAKQQNTRTIVLLNKCPPNVKFIAALPKNIECEFVEIWGCVVLKNWLIKNVFLPARIAKGLVFFCRFFIEYISFLVNTKIFDKKLAAIGPAHCLILNGGVPGAVSCFFFSNECRRRNIPFHFFSLSLPKVQRLSFVQCPRGFFTENLVVNCAAAAPPIQEIKQFRGSNVAVIWNPLSQQSSCQQVKKTRDVSNQYISVGYLGRLESAKGTDKLLEAFCSLCDEFPDVRLVLGGKCLLGRKDSGLMERLIQAGKCEYKGYIEGNPCDFLRELDIFVYPSLHEGLPYAVMEAMSVGCCVIASRVGGIPELIADDRGILVNPADTNGVRDALRKCISDVELRISYSKAASRFAESNFSPAIFESKILALIGS